MLAHKLKEDQIWPVTYAVHSGTKSRYLFDTFLKHSYLTWEFKHVLYKIDRREEYPNIFSFKTDRLELVLNIKTKYQLSLFEWDFIVDGKVIASEMENQKFDYLFEEYLNLDTLEFISEKPLIYSFMDNIITLYWWYGQAVVMTSEYEPFSKRDVERFEEEERRIAATYSLDDLVTLLKDEEKDAILYLARPVKVKKSYNSLLLINAVYFLVVSFC